VQRAGITWSARVCMSSQVDVLPKRHTTVACRLCWPLTAGRVPCQAGAMRCPLCETRTARRACPALGRDICPVCCGTKRLVEIRCPDSCAYLSASRAHPPATVRKQQDQDLAVLTPGLAGLSEPRQQLLLFSLTLVDRFKGDRLDAADDRDVVSAAGALASTYETASRGVIYEHRTDSIPAQRMAEGIRELFDQLGWGRPSGFAADAAAVLRRLEERARAVQQRAGSTPRAFVELAGRMARRLGAQDAAAGLADGQGAPPPAGPSIIVP